MKLWKRLAAGILAAVMAVSAVPAGVSAEEAASRAGEIDYTKDDLYALEGGSIVYVNGKDQKQSGIFYRTCSFQYAGKTLGAKLNVAVLPAKVFDNYDYDQIFTNGKIRSDLAKAGKEYASAKIDQNGKVTVTAGKKAGPIKIFVYEVIDKKLVHSKDGGIGEKYGVNPLSAWVDVNAAPSAILYTTDRSKLIWATESVYINDDGTAIEYQSPLLKKSDSTVTLSVGETVTLYLADKKAIPSDFEFGRDAPFVADSYDGTIVSVNGYSGTDKVESDNTCFSGTEDGMSANADGVCYHFELKGVRAGKTTIIITNPVSGKTAKVKVVVK